MLDWIQVAVLALVQGVTEFLPVSSSAHLILVPELLGWQDQGLAFDVAVHMGTLLAVLTYFAVDLMQMITDFWKSLKGRTLTPHAKMLWFIGFATIPVGLVGLFGKHFVETVLRSPVVIAFATIGFGLLLWAADELGKRVRTERSLTLKDTLFVGFCQALSLIPGASRSGVTLTAGLLGGLTRESAARFSFLLSIPVILLAGGLETVTLVKQNTAVQWNMLGMGVVLSAISGFICIHYFLKLLNKVGVFPFVIYRIALGAFLLFKFY